MIVNKIQFSKLKFDINFFSFHTNYLSNKKDKMSYFETL